MNTLTSVDGTSIAYERSGAGPPLVLVHGTAADHTRWEPLRPALEKRFTVYAIGRRGRGESGDATDYALSREAEDVVTLIDSIDDPVVLLGHSYGAMCSLEAALRTDSLDSLVLYEPPLPVSDRDPDSADALDEISALINDGEREQALVHFYREIVGTPPAAIEAYRTSSDWSVRVEAAPTVVREERARKGYEFDATRVAELRSPTLLLYGEESDPFFEDVTHVLDDTLPNSQVTVLTGHGHGAINTAPELFLEEVSAFLGESTYWGDSDGSET